MTARLVASALGLACALCSVWVAGGCGDRDLNASIEKMNKGVESFKAGQAQAAEKDLEEATTLAPQNFQAWYNLGVVRGELKKWDKAAEAFSNAVKNHENDAIYHYRLGFAYLQSEPRNLSQAETHLEQAVKLNDRLFKAHYYLGVVYSEKGLSKKAAEEWTKSASISPPVFGKSFNALAQLYIRWDMLDRAVTVLQTGLAKIDDPEEAAKLYYHLGLAYQKQNKLKEAVEAYGNALERRQNILDARRQRGFAYADMGEKAKARADLEAFVKAGGGGNAFEVQTANQRLLRLAVE
jgi:Tfp pilus assembly protein PilF